MMDEVIKFYRTKEEKFQKSSGLSKAEFKSSIGNIVINVENNYKNDRKTGLKDLDEMMEAVKGSQEIKDQYLKGKNLSQFSAN
jgi:hypothetical protein